MTISRIIKILQHYNEECNKVFKEEGNPSDIQIIGNKISLFDGEWRNDIDLKFKFPKYYYDNN